MNSPFVNESANGIASKVSFSLISGNELRSPFVKLFEDVTEEYDFDSSRFDLESEPIKDVFDVGAFIGATAIFVKSADSSFPDCWF